MKILQKKEMPLLNRVRAYIEIEYPKSKVPPKDEVKKKIAELTKSKEELIIIKHIYPKFGESKAKVITHIYDDLESLKKFEFKKKKAKSKKVKENAKEESKKQGDGNKI